MLADFLTDVIATYQANGGTAAFAKGKDEPARESAPGRVVFTPTKFKFVAIKRRVGGVEKEVRLREQSVEVECWARSTTTTDETTRQIDDVKAVEVLLHDVVRALWETGAAMFRGGPGEFSSDIKTIEFGARAVFTFDVDIPVTRGATTVVMAVAAKPKAEMQFPNGAQQGIPAT